MFRKIMNILIWVLLLAYIGVSLAFTDSKLHDQKIQSLVVEVSDSAQLGFIRWNDINDLLISRRLNVVGEPIDSIDRNEIRKVVLTMHEIRDAEVFTAPDGTLYIRIWQREPVARFIGATGSYYLDEEGEVLNLSDKYSADVLMITGKTDHETAKSMFQMIEYIRQDPLLKVLVEGINVDGDRNLELITRIGNLRVFFGNVQDYEWKFKKLMAFYEQGLPNVGWEKYTSIDLRYDKQVVAKRRDTSN